MYTPHHFILAGVQHSQPYVIVEMIAISHEHTLKCEKKKKKFCRVKMSQHFHSGHNAESKPFAHSFFSFRSNEISLILSYSLVQSLSFFKNDLPPPMPVAVVDVIDERNDSNFK